MPPCGRHGHRVEEVVRRLQTTSCYPCHRVAPSRGDGRSDHGFRREAIVADDVHEPGDDLQVFYARAVCFRDLSGEALTDRYDVIKLKTAGPTRWPNGAGIIAGGPFACVENVPNPYYVFWTVPLDRVSAATVACTHHFGSSYFGLRP